MANNSKVVIVEDETDTAGIFVDMIRLNGFTSLKSYGGTSAINLITEEKPDAIVLDVMMSDLSGLEVLRFIRDDPNLEHIPVVVVSVKNLSINIHAGMDAGTSVFISKPVTYQEL